MAASPEKDLKLHVMHTGGAPERKCTVMFEPELTGYKRKGAAV